MAENRFALTLTAVDRASKTINKVNASVNKLFRPYDNAKKSIKSFSDALSRNDLVKRPLWALDKVGRGVTMFGNAFGVAESSVLGGSSRIAQALGMIGGPIGGFLATTAAVAGGAAAVSVKMSQMGQDISRTAKGLNLSTAQLQEYRGAAKMAGLETESMDDALASLGANLYNEQAGLNQPLAAALQFAQISLKKTKTGAIDTVQALRDIADVVKRMPDQVQAREFTDMLGVSNLLPLLRKGSDGIDEYVAQVRRLGILSDEQIQRLAEQNNAWNQTKTALDAAGVSVGNLVSKYLDLNDAALVTTKLAQSMANRPGGSSSGGGYWSAGNIWDRATPSWLFNPRGIFGMFSGLAGMMSSTAPEGPRSAVGKVTGIAGAGGASPIGIRNNNPGNLRSWPGAGSSDGFARFATPQAGLTAMGRNLLAYQDRYGINTIGGIVNRWAPPSENNTGAYISDVSRQTGFDPNQPLNLHDPKVLAPLISAMTTHENGQQPYSPELLASAIKDALGNAPIKIEVSGAPPGMTFRASRGGSQPTVGVILAPGGMS